MFSISTVQRGSIAKSGGKTKFVKSRRQRENRPGNVKSLHSSFARDRYVSTGVSLRAHGRVTTAVGNVSMRPLERREGREEDNTPPPPPRGVHSSIPRPFLSHHGVVRTADFRPFEGVREV